MSRIEEMIERVRGGEDAEAIVEGLGGAWGGERRGRKAILRA